MVKHNFGSVKGYLKNKFVKEKKEKKTCKKTILCKKFAQRPENRVLGKKKPNHVET